MRPSYLFERARRNTAPLLSRAHDTADMLPAQEDDAEDTTIFATAFRHAPQARGRYFRMLRSPRYAMPSANLFRHFHT